MNTTLQILVTALLVGGGIGGYHLLSAGPSSDPLASTEPGYARQIAALERRVRDLENEGPVLQGTVDAQALWDQLQRLGERVDAVEQAEPASGGARLSAGVTEATGTEPAPADAGSPAAPGASGGPSPLSEAEEQRVRELFQDTMRNRMQDWANRRLDRTLGELGIELRPEQREQLNETIGEHMQSVREVMDKAREDGVPREERRALMEPLNEQLTQKISAFLPVADAEAITKALPTPGRGPGGGGGPGGRGGGIR